MLVAYRRVSSDDQSLDRQLDGVAGVERKRWLTPVWVSA